MTSQAMHYLETLSPEDKALIKCNVMEALALDFNKMKRWNEIMDTLAALCDGKRDGHLSAEEINRRIAKEHSTDLV